MESLYFYVFVGSALAIIGIVRLIIAFEAKDRAETIKGISDNLSNKWKK